MTGLTAFALTLCAARALRGRTMASRVIVEPGSPVDIDAPLICLFAGHGRAHIEGRDLLAGSQATRLRFEMFFPVSAEVDGTTSLNFDTGASLALPFALLWRQVETVLQADNSVWANLFRRFALGYKMAETASDLFELDKGRKIAARIVEIAVDPLDEPMIGGGVPPVWAALIAAMQADGPELASLAAIVQAAIEGPTTLSDWQVVMGYHGLNLDYGSMLGIDLPSSFDPLPIAEQADTESVVVADAVAGTEAGQ